MSKSIFSKASAILIGFFLIAGSVSVVFAQNSRPAVINKQLNQLTATREKLASKEAALKLKLQAFRDQKKATAAARINTNLNQINQNQTTQMQKHLDMMTSILDRLEARVNNQTPDIKNPAAAKTAIASARETIATASAAVLTQAQKDYTIQITSEGRIGLDAKTQRDKLHADILVIRKAVIEAKQSVANAIRVAKTGSAASGTGLKKEGTVSGQQ